MELADKVTDDDEEVEAVMRKRGGVRTGGGVKRGNMCYQSPACHVYYSSTRVFNSNVTAGHEDQPSLATRRSLVGFSITEDNLVGFMPNMTPQVLAFKGQDGEEYPCAYLCS